MIVHPQSTIHSMVEFVDGSILAQFSVTDMRLPILYALTYPDRIASDLRFPVNALRHLDFTPPDLDKFPCLRLAYEAVEAGGAKPSPSMPQTRWRWRPSSKVVSLSRRSLALSGQCFLRQKLANWSPSPRC